MCKSFLVLSHELVDSDPGVMRDHLESLHLFLMTGIETLTAFNHGLLVHDTLSKLVIVMVDPSSFFLLSWEV